MSSAHFTLGLVYLLTLGSGFCLGVLWVLRSRRLAERDDRHALWLAERVTRASIDMARGTSLTPEQAEQALRKAMQVGLR